MMASDRSDPDSLLATLLEGGVNRRNLEIPSMSPLELVQPEDRPENQVKCTDFLTAACGLVLGVGLATGPLYPDLIALVRTCLPTRTRPASRLPRLRRGIRPLRSLGSWLGIR